MIVPLDKVLHTYQRKYRCHYNTVTFFCVIFRLCKQPRNETFALLQLSVCRIIAHKRWIGYMGNTYSMTQLTYLLLLISMLWHRQAIFESKGNKLSSSAESRIRTQRVSDTYSPADWMPADKPTELSRIKLNKTWTRQPVPMISKHSAHLTPLPFGIRTWLWRYRYSLLLISMLWHRQAIFESKGDKLSSSAESRIRTQRVSDKYVQSSLSVKTRCILHDLQHVFVCIRRSYSKFQ